ncbi:MAG: polyphosphate kinase 1 [Thermaurantimonas sp.]|uniref:polyphosphate kinase 1 n=1 Tax=Thermaurantimonas sp. TaxID=2681568 RepID=UPI00391DA002
MNKKKKKELLQIDRYIPRDVSWLDFNARVLQEAADPTVPLVERLRFIGIFSNNLDEFFRVRYATIKRMSMFGKKASRELGGFSPDKLLQTISHIANEQQQEAEEIYEALISELYAKGIVIVDEKNLTTGQKEFIRQFFIDKVSPAVFTLILNPKRPFPQLTDKSIYLAIKAENQLDASKNFYALIELPTDYVGRFVELPKYGKRFFMYLDDLIRYNLNYIFFIFNNYKFEAYTIKITRDAELDIENDISKSFIDKVSESLEMRKTGDPVRFVYDREIPADLLSYLMSRMQLDNYDSLASGGRYHNKKDLMKFPAIDEFPSVYEPLPPLNHPDLDLNKSIMDVVARKDVLLFQPYHSFSFVIRMLREAAIDPDVTSIQITLYRLAEKSRVISAIKNAARNGKKVVVVIELQARFDEEANIKWTEELKNEEVEVIFGVTGLKVHCKLVHITRLRNEKVEHFAIVSTGNFNESTARIYTDYVLLTADPRITRDIAKIFEFFKTNYKVFQYQHLIVSPHYQRLKINELIDSEIKNAKAGKEAYIFWKLNSLSDTGIIEKLYQASQAGVKIRLIVRGICSLIPGKPGLSENIEAISIVDRFLEHSRVYVFANGGEPKYYISSADMMTRNIEYRVEVTCPVYDPKIQREIQDHLDILWKDNCKARLHGWEVKNAYRKTPGPKIRAQIELYEYVKRQLKKAGGRQL